MLDPSTTAAGVRNSITGLISSFRTTSYDEKFAEDQSRSLRSARPQPSKSQKNNGSDQKTDSDSVEGVRASATSTTASSSSHFSAQAPAVLQPNTAVTIDSFIKTVFGSCTGVQQTFEARQKAYDNEDNNRSPNGLPGQHTSNPRSQSRGRGKSPGAGGNGNSRSPDRILNMQVRPSGVEHDECYYARFYADDHAQAAQAVLQLREREEADRAALLASLDDPKVRNMLKLRELGMQHQKPNGPAVSRQVNPATVSELVPTEAPLSNKPSKNDDEAGRLGAIALLAPAASTDEPDENTYIDFDDGISALSSRTLEEMARRDAMMEEAEKAAAESGDKFQTAVAAGWRRHKARQASEAASPEIIRADESPRGVKDFREAPKLDSRKVTEAANNNSCVKTRGVRENNNSDARNLNIAIELNRGLSSASSGTTMTNFESVWKKEEAKYWQDVADGEAGDGDKARRHRRKSKSKGMVEVNEQKNPPPSAPSPLSSQSYHPHDTIAPIIASTVNSPLIPIKKSKSKTRRPKLGGGRSRRGTREYQNFDVDSNGFPTTASYEDCSEI